MSNSNKHDEKVGILTFHASHNCGSMLQAFALQRAIDSLGYNSEIINFSNRGQRDLYSVLPKKNTVKNILKNIILFPHKKRLEKNYNNYEEFKNNVLRLTDEEYFSRDELDENKLGFDNYVCGSDQIWNITIEDSDDAYFLPFIRDHRKFAYAPSFGAKNPEKYAIGKVAFYKKVIKELDRVSIREKNGQKWIKEMTGLNVPLVLDPTLLLKATDYTEIEKKIPVPGHYIFYYAPGYLKDLNSFVEGISKRYKMPVVVFNAKQFYVKMLGRKHGFILPIEEGPGVYLYLMRNADMVFTTSFHGTVFATMFNKCFWTLKNTGMFGDDDRVKTLVEQLGIEDRLIIPREMSEKFDYTKLFNYKEYELRLKKLQEESIEYLRNALAGERGRNG